jgi:hypothetical protein
MVAFLLLFSLVQPLDLIAVLLNSLLVILCLNLTRVMYLIQHRVMIRFLNRIVIVARFRTLGGVKR